MERLFPGSLMWTGTLLAVAAGAQPMQIVSSKGSVSVLRGSGAGEVRRDLHAALVTGDRIVTGDKSKAEVRLDGGGALELGARAVLAIGEAYPGHSELPIRL